jgi:cation diffusion facilitator CzcD-associated flavoprotein CzcO
MTPDYDAIVVGTGFGGMGAAIQLKRLGYHALLMLDRNDDLGGTWHVNRYPGLAVDIPSTTYSYSFEPNPWWTRLYAPGAELKQYARHVADKYDLRRHMRFNTVVEGARYDERRQCWIVQCGDGTPLSARILVMATGFLSQPKMPDIPGIETFAGKTLHTADWDDRHALDGRRAAVIGTGATAVQLLPEIAPRLAQLDVYQRTPIWVTPKYDGAIPPSLRRLFARLPVTQRSARLVSDNVLETIMVSGVLYTRYLPMLNRAIERVCKAHLARQVKDPAIRRRLTPDYTFGCKRPTFSNTYYPTFNRRNVELVTEGIARIEPDGIVTRDGRKRAVDTLILATGFSLWEENFPAVPIVGREGRDLGRWWRETRFQSFEGITMPGFPNLFSIPTPYAYNGLSFFTTIEAQMTHMDRCLRELQRRKAQTFEVTQAANDAYTRDMRRRVGDSVFARGHCATANSYYYNPHGEAVLLRPTSTRAALRQSARFPLDSYHYR